MWTIGIIQTKKLPMKGLDFGLGNHGPASFNFVGYPEFKIEYGLTFNIEFDKVKGTSSPKTKPSFPLVPAFRDHSFGHHPHPKPLY